MPDLYKSMIEGFLGKSLTTKAGGGGTTKGGSAKYLKELERDIHNRKKKTK